MIILRETVIEEKDEAGVGVERGIEIGIQGGEVGVEREIVDIVTVIVIVIVIVVEAEAEAILMLTEVEIGGKGKGEERRGEGGVEVFRHVNNVGLK